MRVSGCVGGVGRRVEKLYKGTKCIISAPVAVDSEALKLRFLIVGRAAVHIRGCRN